MKAIFFDGDDTLWSIDRLYQTKQHEVATFICNKYSGIDYEYIFDRIVLDCNEYLKQNQKFTHMIFPMTCCRTCINEIPEISHEDVLKVYEIADGVFDFEPKLYDDTISTLIELGRMGYKSFILTQGDYMVQSSKIFRLKLYDYVSDSIIVDVKSQEVYETLKERYPTIDRYIMVGDSYQRDIKPAKAAGWETVLVRPMMLGPNGYADRQIVKLSDVLRYIKETDHDIES